jgi:hypothetical protein
MIVISLWIGFAEKSFPSFLMYILSIINMIVNTIFGLLYDLIYPWRGHNNNKDI